LTKDVSIFTRLITPCNTCSDISTNWSLKQVIKLKILTTLIRQQTPDPRDKPCFLQTY